MKLTTLQWEVMTVIDGFVVMNKSGAVLCHCLTEEKAAEITRAVNVLAAVKVDKIHLTITLGEVDALIGAANYMGRTAGHAAARELVTALQKLDEAVNI